MLSRIRVCEKWRVCYSPTIVAVSLPRKVAELRPHMDRGRQTGVARTDQSYIQSIERVGKELTACVAAESFNRMMLTGQHMVPLRTAACLGLLDGAQPVSLNSAGASDTPGTNKRN